MKTILSIVILGMAVAIPMAQVPVVRDNARYEMGKATIAGTVVADEPNGLPIKRAFVTVQLISDARVMHATATDETGRFSITGLPASNVRVIVSKPTYVTTYYGAKQPGSTVGLPVALVDGETTTISVRIPRGAVIAGVIRDENGQPMPGINISLQRVTMSALGQRVSTPTSGALIPSTDDRGAYRVYGLAPGDYMVMAQPGFIGVGEVRATSTAELEWADRQLRTSGAAAGATPEAETGPARSQTIKYASVYFPGTVNAAAAGTVTLAAGQERTGVDMRMQFVQTARVEGTVTGLDGQPARGAQVTLLPEGVTTVGTVASTDQERERLLVLMSAGLVNDNVASFIDGKFSIPNVEPGSYLVLARLAGPAARGGGPGTPVEPQWAMTDIRVDGRDISGIALQLARGQHLAGRIVFDGPKPPIRANISLRAASSRAITVNSTFIAGGEGDDAFLVTGIIPGPYRVLATISGWTLKSAMIGGRDAADTPLDIKPGEDASGLVLTFTNTPSEVTGVLTDSTGKPTSDLSIVLFSADKTMWFGGSRRVRPAIRPGTDGRFAFTDLVAGDYYLAALTDVSAADLANSQFLEQVVPAAIKITLRDGEKKVQDLRIAR